MGEFWQQAKDWYSLAFGVSHTLILTGPRLFGLAKEPPLDLLNVFYRCIRYSIYNDRRETHLSSLKYIITLFRDELKLEYQGN